MSYDLKLEYRLSGKPSRVMQLLTDADLIRKWCGSDAIVEAKVGGKFEMFDGWVFGEVKQITEDELAYTWKTTDWDEATTPSLVHYRLKADGQGGTRLTLEHTNLPTEDEMNSHKTGWSDYFFDPMEDYMLIIDKS